MSHLQKIEDDLKSAMKNKDTFRLGVLRLIKTSLKNKEIELIRPVNDVEFNALLSSLVKQRKEAVEQYKKGGQEELAQNEENEIKIIQEYLPKQLTSDELDKFIKDALQKTGAKEPKDMGLVMKELKEPTSGRVDGKVLAEKVRQALLKA